MREMNDVDGVSVPFNAGRGLMQRGPIHRPPFFHVSVPFNAGRGLMHQRGVVTFAANQRFSTLQCGSWIDASTPANAVRAETSFSTLQCGSWIDAPCLSISSVSLSHSFSTLQCGSWIDAYQSLSDENSYL